MSRSVRSLPAGSRARRFPTRLLRALGPLALGGVALVFPARSAPAADPVAAPPDASQPGRTESGHVAQAERAVWDVPAATTPIRIDGVIDEAAWSVARRLELPYETSPGDNLPPPVRTEMFLTSDARNVYVAFRAHDPEPEGIVAHLSDRDGAFSDDFVGVVFDTWNDERRAFEFFVNPLGVQMDLTNSDVGGGEDSSWDAIWDSAGRITEAGYEVEIAIPFSSLRFADVAKGEPRTWGIDAVRIRPRSRRSRIGLNRLSRDKNCYLCQHSKIRGFVDATPGRNIELDPTLTIHRTDVRPDFPDGGMESGDVEYDPGLTARWGITPNLTLLGTINPDFSQVEADAAQLDVNNQFALFFPEKRPFFLEGADFFDTGLPIVYTRNVADPSWGVKLSGKEGASAVGVFFARDTRTNLILPGPLFSEGYSSDEHASAGAVRWRYDVGKSGTVGVLYTDRTGEDWSSRVAGADAVLRPSDTDRIDLLVLSSRTRYPEGVAADHGQPEGGFGDLAYRINYNHDGRDWYWYARYEDIGEEFRADLGYVPQVDRKFLLGGLGRLLWGKPEDAISLANIGADWDRTEDHAGHVLEQEAEAWVNVDLPRQSYVSLDVGIRDRWHEGRTFDQKFLNFTFRTRPMADLRTGLYIGAGDQIDFEHVRSGSRVRIQPDVQLNIGRNFRLELYGTWEKFDVDAGEPGTAGTSGRLYTARLVEARAVWQFDVRTFARLIVQHSDVRYDRALWTAAVPERSRDLFTQLLFSYKVNPQTVLFLGYSDSSFAEDRPLVRADRTVFLKVGYAWLL